MSTSRDEWRGWFRAGTIQATVGRASSIEEAGRELGVTRSAIQSAWRRFAPEFGLEPAISRYLGDRSSANRITAAELDAMDLKLPRAPKTAEWLDESTVRVAPKNGEKWLVVSDIHFGIEDPVAMQLVMECGEREDVDRVVMNGDIFDCYSISRHDQYADRVRGKCYTLPEEVERSREFMEWAAARSAPGFFNLGNHEDRLRALVNRNVGLLGSLDPRAVFAVPDRIHVMPHFGRIVAGSLHIEHGHQLRGSLTRYGVHRILDRHPEQTTICGHAHRIAQVRVTSFDEQRRPRTRMAMTMGHLSIARHHEHYAPNANWQQGFGIVEFWRGRGGEVRFTVDAIEIHDHEFNYRGRTYRAPRRGKRVKNR